MLLHRLCSSNLLFKQRNDVNESGVDLKALLPFGKASLFHQYFVSFCIKHNFTHVLRHYLDHYELGNVPSSIHNILPSMFHSVEGEKRKPWSVLLMLGRLGNSNNTSLYEVSLHNGLFCLNDWKKKKRKKKKLKNNKSHHGKYSYKKSNRTIAKGIEEETGVLGSDGDNGSDNDGDDGGDSDDVSTDYSEEEEEKEKELLLQNVESKTKTAKTKKTNFSSSQQKKENEEEISVVQSMLQSGHVLMALGTLMYAPVERFQDAYTTSNTHDNEYMMNRSTFQKCVHAFPTLTNVIFGIDPEDENRKSSDVYDEEDSSQTDYTDTDNDETTERNRVSMEDAEGATGSSIASSTVAASSNTRSISFFQPTRSVPVLSRGDIKTYKGDETMFGLLSDCVQFNLVSIYGLPKYRDVVEYQQHSLGNGGPVARRESIKSWSTFGSSTTTSSNESKSTSSTSLKNVNDEKNENKNENKNGLKELFQPLHFSSKELIQHSHTEDRGAGYYLSRGWPMQAFHRALAEIAAQREGNEQSTDICEIPISALEPIFEYTKSNKINKKQDTEQRSDTASTASTASTTAATSTTSTASTTSASTAPTTSGSLKHSSSDFSFDSFDGVELILKLNTNEKNNLQKIAREVALRHLLEPSVLAACTCFLDLCGLDTVRETLRVDAEAAIRIYRWKCRRVLHAGKEDTRFGRTFSNSSFSSSSSSSFLDVDLRMDILQEVSELFIAFPNSPEPGHAAVSSALASLGETTRALVGDITNEDSGAVLEWKLVSVFCRVHGLKTSIALVREFDFLILIFYEKSFFLTHVTQISSLSFLLFLSIHF